MITSSMGMKPNIEQLSRSNSHLSVLDSMRGIAALAVVLFHYSVMLLPSILPNDLSFLFKNGKLGVQVFFVISGFVIPFALHRAEYSIKDYRNFMARRWVRIAPPAYIAACFMIIYYLASLLFLGKPIVGWDFPGFGIAAILSNLTFTCEYTGGNWYNFVYWSLQAEFEFYLLIGLIYPLLLNREYTWLPALTLLALLLISWPLDLIFCKNAEFFVLGIIGFLWKGKRINTFSAVALVLLCCVIALNGRGILATSVGLITLIIILSDLHLKTRVTDLLGTISYSLYITHVPVGSFSESALKRVLQVHEYPIGKVAMLFVYTLIAIAFAYMFYRFVEKPFIHWSRSLSRNKRSRSKLTV